MNRFSHFQGETLYDALTFCLYNVIYAISPFQCRPFQCIMYNTFTDVESLIPRAKMVVTLPIKGKGCPYPGTTEGSF